MHSPPVCAAPGAARRQHVKLALTAPRVGLVSAAITCSGASPRQPSSPAGPYSGFSKRLRRDRTDAAPGVRAPGADGEEAARDRDAEAAVLVAGDDRPGHG
jgi:hypothetical protein